MGDLIGWQYHYLSVITVEQQEWMIEQGFHDNTEHNYVFAFVFKKIAGKIPGNHRWGNTKARRKKQ